MEGEGKSANTIRLHLAVLSHLFTVARVRKPRLPKGRGCGRERWAHLSAPPTCAWPV